jgi:dethiobiotin synthetase
MNKTVFISGIDTDTGKSIVTGLMALSLQNKGVNVITQKFIQTGNTTSSEDIEKHREIMGVEPLDVDKDRTTCPLIFTYPCSPHLAAEIDNTSIDVNLIKSSTAKLEEKFDKVLLEGAGGLFVPITREYYTIDYVQENNLPLILVTSSKLGSINHTLMSLELCKTRGINLVGLVYNEFPNDSEQILKDSEIVFRNFLDKNYPDCKIINVPIIKDNKWPILDFSSIL